MAKRSQRKASGLLSGYSLSKTALLRPDRKLGTPGLRQGTDSSSRRILLKYWPRTREIDDSDLEEIWRSEIRQLQRLAAAPNADEYLVRMVANGLDEAQFYIVLDVGEALPLQVAVDNASSIVLQTTRQPHSRSLLWRNFGRLVSAVEILHTQGIIHRNIDQWCVLTNLRSKPDFRLTGFEWSMRIAVTAHDAKRARPAAIRQRPASSFAADWADLAFVFANVLEIPLQRLADMTIVPSAVVEHAAAAEIRLLRTMMGLLPADRLDAEEIQRQLAGVLLSLKDELATDETRYFCAVTLGDRSRLTARIREALDYSIDVDEIAEQLEFLINDIGSNPLIVGYNKEVGGEISLLLCGERLNYRLGPWKRRGSTDPESWAFSMIEDADAQPPLPMAIRFSRPVQASSIAFRIAQDAHNDFPKLRGRSLPWDELVIADEKTAIAKSPPQRVIQALSLLLRLEMAYAATLIYPVRVLTRPENASHQDRFRIEVSDEPDSDRQALANALKLDAPAVRLQKLLAPNAPNDEIRQSIEWALLDVGSLGTRANVTKWRVETAPSTETDGIFTLEGSSPPHVVGRGYLTPAETSGNLTQLKRRQKALSVLANHTELLQVLVDQRNNITDSQEKLDKTDAAFASLDDSKKLALGLKPNQGIEGL